MQVAAGETGAKRAAGESGGDRESWCGAKCADKHHLSWLRDELGGQAEIYRLLGQALCGWLRSRETAVVGAGKTMHEISAGKIFASPTGSELVPVFMHIPTALHNI